MTCLSCARFSFEMAHFVQVILHDVSFLGLVVLRLFAYLHLENIWIYTRTTGTHLRTMV